MNLQHWLAQSDGIGLAVSLALLVMSVISWFIILYKARLLHVAAKDLNHCQALFWQASDWEQAQAQWQASDRHTLFLGLLQALAPEAAVGMARQASPADQLTRRLREALRLVRARLQWGQDVLATTGATAPFVGLLGTVWGIYHALSSLAVAGQYTLDKVAQPVGEALVMTAAGLAVAIPAVMAYNLMGRRLARLDAQLEGFAYDLRALAQGETRKPPH